MVWLDGDDLDPDHSPILHHSWWHWHHQLQPDLSSSTPALTCLSLWRQCLSTLSWCVLALTISSHDQCPWLHCCWQPSVDQLSCPGCIQCSQLDQPWTPVSDTQTPPDQRRGDCQCWPGHWRCLSRGYGHHCSTLWRMRWPSHCQLPVSGDQMPPGDHLDAPDPPQEHCWRTWSSSTSPPCSWSSSPARSGWSETPADHWPQYHESWEWGWWRQWCPGHREAVCWAERLCSGWSESLREMFQSSFFNTLLIHATNVLLIINSGKQYQGSVWWRKCC